MSSLSIRATLAERASCHVCSIAADLEALASKAKSGGMSLKPGGADALRVISSLERARRLAEDYTQCILDVFADRALSLGESKSSLGDAKSSLGDAEC
jgi:hypothetical protein